jgi:hypothetical protein
VQQKTSWCNIKKHRCGLNGQELAWINIEPILGVLSSINGFVSMARILIPHPKKLTHVFDLEKTRGFVTGSHLRIQPHLNMDPFAFKHLANNFGVAGTSALSRDGNRWV